MPRTQMVTEAFDLDSLCYYGAPPTCEIERGKMKKEDGRERRDAGRGKIKQVKQERWAGGRPKEIGKTRGKEGKTETN